MNLKRNTDRGSRGLLYGWVLFAVSSLVFAGIFALLVALARTPLLQELFSGRDYVRVALVGHVNMAFVVWFLAFEGALWVYVSTSFLASPVLRPGLGWAGLLLSVLGTALIVASSVFALGEPLFVNYVPVISHPVFYAGLGLLSAGMTITLFTSLITAWKSWNAPEAIGPRLFAIGAAVSGVAVFFALICFLLSYHFQTKENTGFIDLERLFWGGGHVLQFANTAAMVSVWVYLTHIIFKASPVREGLGKTLLALFLVTILPSPLIYFLYNAGDLGQTRAFTLLMEFGLGPSAVVFGGAVILTVLRKGLGGHGKLPWRKPEFSSLVMSMALFAFGGVVSLAISGYNTKIPAHYHGVIGGVTMAFMGMTYHLTGVLGKEVFSRRVAVMQPYVYGLGQTLFVAGMFWAGSLGVERKTFGEAQGLDDPAKVVAMAVFGLGGLLAIAGGVLFVANAGASLFRSSLKEPGCALDAKPEEAY